MSTLRSLCTGVVVLVAVAAASARAQDNDTPQTWVTYKNARFGTTIRYPADWFRPGPAPANDDGRRFTSVDGAASFTVSGGFVVTDRGDLRRWALEHIARHGGRVTYSVQRGDWWVLSGYVGDRAFYDKTIFSHGGRVHNDFRFEYPIAQRRRYDPLIAPMMRSFKPGRGYDTE